MGVFRGFLCAGLALFLANSLFAQGASRLGARAQVAEIDEAEGLQRIEALRNYRSDGDTAFRFSLRHYPRRGDPIRWRGVLWSRWEAGGPILRIAVSDWEGTYGVAYLMDSPGHRLFRRESGGPVEKKDAEAWHHPMVEGNILTPFDLTAGFLFWDDPQYEGSSRLKGRPAHLFRFYAPEDLEAGGVESVRAGLDARFNAPLLAEFLDSSSRVTRSVEVVNLRQAGDEWIVRTFDIFDPASGARARLTVDAAATGVDPDWRWWDPETLAEPTRLPVDQMEEF